MDLNCIFYSHKFDAGYKIYRCLITSREIPLNKEVCLIGRHEVNKSHDDVTHVEFSNCKLRQVPQKLTKSFPNLKVLRITNSELKEVRQEDLEEYRGIKRLVCDFNELEFLSGNLFEGFRHLELLSFRGNELRMIEPSLLDGLDGLQHVDLRDNPNYSKCYSMLSCKDSNAELEDVKVQLAEKFFAARLDVVDSFVRKLRNPIEQLKKYESMSTNVEVKLQIVELRTQLFEELTSKKIKQLRNSESSLNQEVKSFINFESKLIREINALRNFEGKLTQEIQELKRINSRQTLIRQQSEPAHSSNDIPVAALRQELQSWRNLASQLRQEVQKLKGSESKLRLEVQNLRISLQIENLRKSALLRDCKGLEEATAAASTQMLPDNVGSEDRKSQIEDEPGNSSHSKHQTEPSSVTSTSHPHPSFLIDIKQHIQDEITKDFIIKIGEQEFLVHKFLLAARSAALADILNKNPFIDSLNLTNVSIESFQHVLRFIYTDELPTEDEVDFVDLFEAAGRLKIEELKNFAGRKVLDRVDAGNAIEIFNLSSKYGHRILRQRSFEEIKKNYESK